MMSRSLACFGRDTFLGGLAVASTAVQVLGAPLVPVDQMQALSAEHSGFENFKQAGPVSDMVIPAGDMLRLTEQSEIRAFVASAWRQDPLIQASNPYFPGFPTPAVSCPPQSPVGEACTLTFKSTASATPAEAEALNSAMPAGGRVAPMTPEPPYALSVAAALDVIVRFDVLSGAPSQQIPPYTPLPAAATGTPVDTRTAIKNVTLPDLGTFTLTCRRDAIVGTPVQRYACSVPFGAFLVSVARDTRESEPKTSEQVADDTRVLQLVGLAFKSLVKIVSDSPRLWRAALPEKPSDSDQAAAMMSGGAFGDTATAARAMMARNADRLPWHDVTSQTDWLKVCRFAVLQGKPMVIVVMASQQGLGRTLYGDQALAWSEPSVLVAVRPEPLIGPNSWAAHFAKAIGFAGQDLLIVTSRPTNDQLDCQVDAVYRTEADHPDVKGVLEALATGRPPQP